MAATQSTRTVPERRRVDPNLGARLRAFRPHPVRRGVLRSLGLGLITGASDDDPVAIGTYSAAGALLGPEVLWTAPVVYPMTFAVVYLASKIGQIAGKGLFAVIREYYSPWLLYTLLATAVIGNVVEAGADLGGMAAAMNVITPVSTGAAVVVIGLAMLGLQAKGYQFIRTVFRWLALALLAYVGSAVLARPGLMTALRGTIHPHLYFNREFLAMMVAIVGANLSAYLYSWESNQEVEEDISMGRRRLTDRMGTTQEELRRSRHDIAVGVFFADLVMYFILLATVATLFAAGQRNITSAAQAAQALEPLAGPAAGLLFAAGVIGAGVLAVPVMTMGAAFDLCQSFRWRHGLQAKFREAKPFYIATGLFTLAAVGLNFFGINPMKALVYAGIVQGISTPFLMVVVLLVANNPKIMGPWTNRPAMNLLGWVTAAVMLTAGVGLLATFL